MSTVSTSIQHYTEGPNYCKMVRKYNRHKGWKGVKSSLSTDDRIKYTEYP